MYMLHLNIFGPFSCPSFCNTVKQDRCIQSSLSATWWQHDDLPVISYATHKLTKLYMGHLMRVSAQLHHYLGKVIYLCLLVFCQWFLYCFLILLRLLIGFIIFIIIFRLYYTTCFIFHILDTMADQTTTNKTYKKGEPNTSTVSCSQCKTFYLF